MSKFIIERDDNGDYCRVLDKYRGYFECDQCGGSDQELVAEWCSETGYDIWETYGCYGGASSYDMTADEAKAWALENLDKQDAALVVQSIARFEDWRLNGDGA